MTLAALLVVAVVAGLRGEIPPLSFRGPLRDHAVAVGVALEAVLAVLLVAVGVRRRRAPQDAVLVMRLRGLLTAALAIGLAGIPVAVALANLPKPRARRRPSRPVPEPAGYPAARAADPAAGRPPVASAGRPFPHRAARGRAGGRRDRLVIMLRRQATRAAGAGLLPVTADDEDDDDEENLREAVESGRAALRELDDARAAIIACYLAMERSLAGAGAARAAAETPDELLARAASAGLVRGAAAGRLTALFYEARFSSHPLPGPSRTAAQQALSDLAASLAGPAAAGAGRPGRSAGGYRLMTGRQPGDGGSWRDARPEIIIAAILRRRRRHRRVRAGRSRRARRGGNRHRGDRPGRVPRPAAAGAGEPPPETAEPRPATSPASFTGFWRKRAGLADGIGSAAAYDAALRPTLQHLLAARLAERHGISLRDDPDQARRLLCRGQRDDGLWYWVDPARPAGRRPGRPARHPAADARPPHRPTGATVTEPDQHAAPDRAALRGSARRGGAGGRRPPPRRLSWC